MLEQSRMLNTQQSLYHHATRVVKHETCPSGFSLLPNISRGQQNLVYFIRSNQLFYQYAQVLAYLKGCFTAPVRRVDNKFEDCLLRNCNLFEFIQYCISMTIKCTEKNCASISWLWKKNLIQFYPKLLQVLKQVSSKTCLLHFDHEKKIKTLCSLEKIGTWKRFDNLLSFTAKRKA